MGLFFKFSRDLSFCPKHPSFSVIKWACSILLCFIALVFLYSFSVSVEGALLLHSCFFYGPQASL